MRFSALSPFASLAWRICYDNDPGDDAPQAGDVSDGDNDPGNSDAVDGKTRKLIPQEEVDRIVEDRLARDRRARERQFEELESQYQALLSNSSLSQQERQRLEENLADIQKQLRSKEQQAAYEKKALETEYGKKLKDLESKATLWESRYREETVTRALQDAAVIHDAYNPSQIVAQLRPMTKLVEVMDDKTGRPTGKLRPMIDFADTNPDTGEEVMTQRSPDETVKRLKELPAFANLFRANVVSGIGSNSATGGLSPGQGGKVDVSKLTPAQYRKIRAENPELLGLRPRR